MTTVPALEEVLDVVSNGIIVLDTAETVVRWSNWLQRVSGIGAATACGQPLTALFPELTGGRVMSAIQSALQQGFPSTLSQSLNKAPFPLFARIPQEDGAQRIQQKIQVLPLKRAGKVTGCLVEIFDVSLAVHRENVLNTQKNFLNTILDSEPECVMVLAADGRVTQINRSGLESLEVQRLEEVQARGFLDFVLPAYREQVAVMTDAAIAGESRQMEFEIRGGNGSYRWVESTATPLRDEAGKVGGLLMVGRDITARRKAEATTRALIDASRDAAMLLGRAGEILAANEAAALTLGRARQDLLGTAYLSLLAPSTARETQLAIDRVFAEGISMRLAQSYYGAQFDTNIYPVKDGDEAVSSVAIYSTDVTEREQQLEVDNLFHEIDKRILLGHAKQSLFDYICRQVARIFDFPVAWIGRKISGGQVSLWARGAQDDCDAGYFEKIGAIGLRWDNSPLSKGVAGSAIRSGELQIAHLTDRDLSPWRSVAEAHNLRSFLSIPLILRGEVFGSLALASRVDHAFDNAGTLRRLTDIASRICVAEERAIDHEQLRLLQTALSAAANGVFITDRDGRIEWLNAAFVSITGYSETEALGATPTMLRIGKGDTSFFAEMLQGIAAGEAWVGETSERRKDGALINIRQTITPIRDEDGVATHFISILEDVTLTREAEASVMRLAHYDYLTSLPNRALFNDRLQNAVTRAKRGGDGMALMFLDLDHFKQVNDTHGHDVGDLLLQQVAMRLQSCVRESDTLARLAGDEFTILLPAIAAREDVAVVAEKIVAAFARPFDLDGITVHSATSIGIALYPQDAVDAAGLMKRADTAMYVAKNGGRNSFAFYSAPPDTGSAPGPGPEPLIP